MLIYDFLFKLFLKEVQMPTFEENVYHMTLLCFRHSSERRF